MKDNSKKVMDGVGFLHWNVEERIKVLRQWQFPKSIFDEWSAHLKSKGESERKVWRDL